MREQLLSQGTKRTADGSRRQWSSTLLIKNRSQLWIHCVAYSYVQLIPYRCVIIPIKVFITWICIAHSYEDVISFQCPSMYLEHKAIGFLKWFNGNWVGSVYVFEDLINEWILRTIVLTFAMQNWKKNWIASASEIVDFESNLLRRIHSKSSYNQRIQFH